MNEKSMCLPGKGLRGSVLLLLMTISLSICVIATTQGCAQVSSDTVMQCYVCIQALQEAISSALQKEETPTMSKMNSANNGKKQLLTLSTQDLHTLDASLRLLMDRMKSYQTSPEPLPKNTMTGSSPYNTDSPAEHSINSQIRTGDYMTTHYSGGGN